MIATLLAGGLAAVAALVILRPYAAAHRAALTVIDPDEDRRAALLRQLRDLDVDLAAGKLSAADHRRLRPPIEGEAVAVLRRIEERGGSGELVAGMREVRHAAVAAPARKPRSARRSMQPRRKMALGLLLSLATVTVVGVALTGAVKPRGAGAVAKPAAAPTPTAQQAAALSAAEARVRQQPKNLTAHLDLARDYSALGQPQSATIEYLAAIRLDPTNAEASTALALVAFEAGQAAQGKQLVDAVLQAHPRFPEALYARGLIELMGLRQPAAARADLNAYLSAAPFGSHRATVQTLLAMTEGGGAK
jgi:cytochrome c-type biogenesis protein CcmH/NrfG